jgi:hypothetical protein
MEDRKISNNFSLSEFGYVEPEPDLINLLQSLRNEVRSPIVITSACRSISDHINIYRRLYDQEWINKIPWRSRHLPAFNKGLRAVDFIVKRNVGVDMDGEEIAPLVEDIADDKGITIGVGVGKKFLHLDVDRRTNTKWYYDY